MITEYKTISSVSGPIITVNQVESAKVDELAEIELQSGKKCLCKVLEIDGDRAVVQLFDNAEGINLRSSKVRFLGHQLELSVSEDMLGRVFDGIGRPIDGGPEILAEARRDIGGKNPNPTARSYPNEFIQTGISAIDGLNALARGETISIFSGCGLPSAELASAILRQAKVSDDNSGFAIIIAGIGLTFEDADYFARELRRIGANDRAVSFVNLAVDPVCQRLAVPQMALTAAEFLAFEKDMHVFVIMSDMTNFSEALNEVRSSRNSATDRNGYSGYLSTELSSLYERAGSRIGKSGSITLLPIFTMPGDDIAHPVIDIARQITEGGIVLSRELFKKRIIPPVDVLLSQSRIREKCIGSEKTREDHLDLMCQLLEDYAEGIRVRTLMTSCGVSALLENEKPYSTFADAFEKSYVNQIDEENRSIENTLNLGWNLLSMLPASELRSIRPEFIEKYLPKTDRE